MDSNNKSYVDLEFYQNVIPQLVGEKTTGFDSAGPHERRTIGDLIITVEDSGNGSFSPVSYRQWQPGSDFRTFDYCRIMPASSTHPQKSEFKISIPYDAF